MPIFDVMSKTQVIPPNTWMQVLGTDVQILIDGIDENVALETEAYRNDHGDGCVIVTSRMKEGATLALRAPRGVDT